ncbi:hypothetical protein FACS189465_0730 [Clostridia bacterium]|nr:hypothetical protein FACS189465_0730 [Clostridia bacterium]
MKNNIIKKVVSMGTVFFIGALGLGMTTQSAFCANPKNEKTSVHATTRKKGITSVTKIGSKKDLLTAISVTVGVILIGTIIYKCIDTEKAAINPKIPSDAASHKSTKNAIEPNISIDTTLKNAVGPNSIYVCRPGISNPGNCCFIIAVIQALYGTTLKDIVLAQPPAKKEEQPAVAALQSIYTLMDEWEKNSPSNGKRYIDVPDELFTLYNNSGLPKVTNVFGIRQSDSDQFIIGLFDKVIEEIFPKPKEAENKKKAMEPENEKLADESNESYKERIYEKYKMNLYENPKLFALKMQLFHFLGCSQLESTDGTNALSCRYQLYNGLCLPTDEFNNLQDMVNNFMATETINDDVYLNGNKRPVCQTFKVKKEDLPEYMKLNINRYKINAKTSKEEKTSNEIAFDDTFYVQCDTGEKINYEICGIIVHLGDTPYSGHYLAYSKIKDTKNWLKFNDSRVTIIESDDKFEAEKKNNICHGFYIIIARRI